MNKVNIFRSMPFLIIGMMLILMAISLIAISLIWNTLQTRMWYLTLGLAFLGFAGGFGILTIGLGYLVGSEIDGK
jgi:hypothetical protein